MIPSKNRCERRASNWEKTLVLLSEPDTDFPDTFPPRFIWKESHVFDNGKLTSRGKQRINFLSIQNNLFLSNFILYQKTLHFSQRIQNIITNSNHAKSKKKSDLTQFESNATFYRIQQLITQLAFIVIRRQFQEVQASTRCHETVQVIATVLNCKRWIQVFES